MVAPMTSSLPRVACLAAALAGCADVVATSQPARDAAADTPADTALDVSLSPGLSLSLAITDVALFQAVRVPILRAGAVVTSRAIPVIAGRRAVVRVYVTPEAGYSPGSISGELTVRRGGAQTVVTDRRYIETASREQVASGVFAFEVPAEMIDADTRLSVRLLTPGGADVATGTLDRARFPYDGSEHAVAAVDGGPIEVTLVPFRWNADGSGRLPDTSVGQVESFRAALQAMYPVRDVSVDVRAPVDWRGGLLDSGDADFGALLSALRALRFEDDAPNARYYYGMIAPAEYFDTYCSLRCVLGQSYPALVPEDPEGRVAAGVAFGVDSDARTFVHELGHSHGRAHSPCGGAFGVDESFPYAQGTLGVWGYDARRRAFIPSSAFDFMGYCTPDWVSDYTYVALWERIVAVNWIVSPRGLAPSTLAQRPLRHRVLRFGAAMAPAWLDALDHFPVPEGRATLRWRDAAGRVLRASPARADRLSDSDETHVLVPPAPPGARALDVTLDGVTRGVALPARW